ncbi:MAG: hypothetical protein HWE13_06430 [Gammaproteobacteria bacterium]|nr:hypothetical protein [Gammaproteobacteria bacterium]
MSEFKPQFKMKIHFDFLEHDETRRQWFMFGEDLHRRVPMQMDGIDGLNTVGMFIDRAGTFKEGDFCEVDCVVIAPELFEPVLKVGSKGKLWDGGFFASIEVTKVYKDGWQNDL